MDEISTEEIFNLETGDEISVSFASKQYTLIRLELIEPAETGTAERPDLAICPSGIRIDGNTVKVRVYSQGAVSSPECLIVLRDANGEVAATAVIPELPAPLELNANWIELQLSCSQGTDLSRGSVQIDPEGIVEQITRQNTLVTWDSKPW
jgi:hypothetical protein